MYIDVKNCPECLYAFGDWRFLTEEVVLSQGQRVVRHHQSIRGLQEPHRSAVQKRGTEETLFIHTPQHWSSTGVHHHPSWRDEAREGRMEGEEIKGEGESERGSHYCGLCLPVSPKPQLYTHCHVPFLIGNNSQLLSQLLYCRSVIFTV